MIHSSCGTPSLFPRGLLLGVLYVLLHSGFCPIRPPVSHSSRSVASNFTQAPLLRVHIECRRPCATRTVCQVCFLCAKDGRQAPRQGSKRVNWHGSRLAVSSPWTSSINDAVQTRTTAWACLCTSWTSGLFIRLKPSSKDNGHCIRWASSRAICLVQPPLQPLFRLDPST